MDPLTHTLTGLALSRAVGKRVSAHATPILLLAGNAPDIDIATLAGGQLSYLHYHRHLTHTFLLAPLIALLPVLVVRLIGRKPIEWKGAYAISLLGVLSHLLLDWTNIYGIRFLLPFSGEWFRLDIANVVDAWFWTALLIAALAPMLSRLVSSEIGARASSGRGIAIFALAFLSLYSFGRYLAHERALETLNARLYEGETPTRVAAVPDAFNPFRWTGIIETPSAYRVAEMNLLSQFDPAAGKLLYKPELGPREHAAAEAARKTEAFRVFLGFAQYTYWRFDAAPRIADGIRVEAMDLRFGAPPQPKFVATAIVDSAGRVVESGFRYTPPAEQ